MLISSGRLAAIIYSPAGMGTILNHMEVCTVCTNVCMCVCVCVCAMVFLNTALQGKDKPIQQKHPQKEVVQYKN